MKHSMYVSQPVLLRTVSLAALLSFLCFSATANADMYRWVGQDNQVHYGDTLPPSQSGRGYEVINPATGEVTQTVAPAKTQAQLAAEAAAKKAQEADAAKQAEQERQDQILLNLYSSVDDIKRARNTRLDDISRQIEQLQGAIKRAKQRANDTSLSEGARRDALNDARNMQQNVDQLNEKHDQTVLQFDRTIKRFKDIKKDQSPQGGADSDPSG